MKRRAYKLAGKTVAPGRLLLPKKTQPSRRRRGAPCSVIVHVIFKQSKGGASRKHERRA